MNFQSAFPFTAIASCALALTAAASVRAETIVCPVTRDVALGSVGAEADGSAGKSAKMKLKGYQEFGLLDFDVSALKGRKITGATLKVHAEGGMKYGGAQRGTDLRWFTLSTIGADWEEGMGTRLEPDAVGLGASLNEAKHKTQAWAHAGSKVYDVTLGNGQSLRCDVDAGEPQDGWMMIPVDVKLVEALVAKASHGLLLMDGSVFISANCYVATRESKTPPSLLVRLADGETDAAPPAAPAAVTVEPAPLDADAKTGAAWVTLNAPADAFAYEIKINGRPLPRWQIPFAAEAGVKQRFLLEYLEPGKEFQMEIAAIDKAGNISAPASLHGRASDAIHVPALPVSQWQPIGGPAPVIAGKLSAWAIPEICKLAPISGAVLQEKGMEAAEQKNAVWDAATQTIHTAAARGEIAGFQLACKTLDAQPRQITVNTDGLEGIGIKSWRTWFVKVKEAWQPDYAIPMKAGGSVQIPDAQNAIPGQRVAVIAFDLIVPATAPVGEHTGSVSVALDGGGQILMPVKLRVHAATLPPQMHFIPELNCYRGPLGEAGSAAFNDAMKLVHYHRNSLNRVPHSHSGRTDEDWVPKVDDKGHVTDWTAFDAKLGPLLDGSLFKDNPRSGTPVPALYLPFNESWPLPIKPNYDPGPDVPLVGDDWLPRHNILARPPEAAFNADYKKAFSNCVAEFVRHFEEKRWTRTLMEGFNNNKAGYGNIRQKNQDGTKVRVKAMTGTAWTLDEPSSLLDWQALRFFSTLFHNGLGEMKTARFVYRADISRPNWQGSYMDGKMEVMVSNGALFNMMPLMKAHHRRMPAMIMAYGACNSQDRSNHETTAWALKAYTHGCDGVLPWQSLGGDDAFDKGDFTGPNGAAANGNALIVDGSKRFGVNAIASFRVHAFRQGAQMAEMLRLLEIKNHWGRAHSLTLVSQIIPLTAEYRQKFSDDAAGLTFDALNGNDLARLKEGLLQMLDE